MGLRTAWRPAPGPTLALLLVGGLVVRVLYVLAQPATDPAFAMPSLDGEYYMKWAASLASGAAGPADGQAYYLAPLYPFLLAGFLRTFGDQVGVLYIVQHALIVAAAGLLFMVGSKLSGAWSGVAGAALLLTYHPVLFFASRPVGEAVALFLLALALFLGTRPGTSSWRGLTGLTLGLASLARPNVMLLSLMWAGIDGLGRNWRGALLIAAGTSLALSPVALRNWRVSGHPVLISSNGGMTLYQGNHPSARGIGVLPAELSGRVDRQSEEATRAASLRIGHTVDAVEADAFWGSQALQARRNDPLGTLRLVARRLALTASSVELSLDYSPNLDRDPWRHAAPLPFGAILGLALAALWLVGMRGSGGVLVWSAVAAAAVVPLAFYVSSRYRLPLAAVLCVPAGIGAAALGDRRIVARRRRAGLGIACAILVASFFTTATDLRATPEAVLLANRAVQWTQLGQRDKAAADLQQAIAEDPRSVPALFGLGLLAEADGHAPEAEGYYRRALDRDPAHVAAACNLGRLLTLQQRGAEALPILRRALGFRPADAGGWSALIVTLHTLGRDEEARRAVAEAASLGVVVPAELQSALTGGRSSPEAPSP